MDGHFSNKNGALGVYLINWFSAWLLPIAPSTSTRHTKLSSLVASASLTRVGRRSNWLPSNHQDNLLDCARYEPMHGKYRPVSVSPLALQRVFVRAVYMQHCESKSMQDCMWDQLGATLSCLNRLGASMTSSIKSQIHNVSQRRQRGPSHGHG